MANNMDYPDSKIIGERVRTARFMAKLTLKELADKTGIGYATLSRIECGKKVINIEELIQVCKYTNKPITYFLHEGNTLLEFYYPPAYREKS